MLRGAIVRDLVTAFDRNFDYFVGVKKSRGIFNTNLYWDATRKVLGKTGKVPISYKTDPKIVANVARLQAREPALEFRPSTCRFIQNRPRLKETYIQQAYIKLIERARREVLVANAYFVPTPSMALALTDAARRCVSVTLISNSPETNDLPEISLVGRGHYKDLLAVNESPEVGACPNTDAGLRIWEWIGQAPGKRSRGQGTMHSKYAVIDRERAWSAPTTSTRAAKNSTARRRSFSSSPRWREHCGQVRRQRPEVRPRGDPRKWPPFERSRKRDRTLPQVDRPPFRRTPVISRRDPDRQRGSTAPIHLVSVGAPVLGTVMSGNGYAPSGSAHAHVLEILRAHHRRELINDLTPPE